MPGAAYESRGTSDCGRITLVLFRTRRWHECSRLKEEWGVALEKAVRRKPLARRTRDLCKLNGAREVGRRCWGGKVRGGEADMFGHGRSSTGSDPDSGHEEGVEQRERHTRSID